MVRRPHSGRREVSTGKMKKLRLTCRETTRLVLEGEERSLGLAERIALLLHWRICAACMRFRRQHTAMRVVLDRWRAYRED